MRYVHVSRRPTARLCRALAAFGLAPVLHTGRSLSAPGCTWLERMQPGHIALICGPSGAGKSTLVRAIAGHARVLRWRPLVLQDPGANRPVIDLVRGPLAECIAILARAGLGEPALFARTPRELSEGERFRLRLALALHEAQSGPAAQPLLLVDEFASALDRVTARTLCMCLRRWTARHQVRVVCATAHDDVAPWLAPDIHLSLTLGAQSA
ncbi:MAG: ATP-binding cassette domain-containing protein [Phycisphaerales bacterium]